MSAIHKVYYYRMNFLTVMHVEANERSMDMFKTCCANLNEIISTQTVSKYMYEDSKSKTAYMIRQLNISEGCLCGVIGKYKSEITGLIAQCDINTMTTNELRLDEPNLKFENYTYFSISAKDRTLIVVDNRNLSTQIHRLISNILTKLLIKEPYIFVADPIINTDVDNRIKAMSGNVIIEGTIEDSESVFTGRPKLKTVNDAIGGHVSACIKYRFKEVRKDKVAENYNALRELCSDPKYSKMCIKEDTDDERGIIDIIENSFQKQSKLSLDEDAWKSPELVYEKMCSLFY